MKTRFIKRFPLTILVLAALAIPLFLFAESDRTHPTELYQSAYRLRRQGATLFHRGEHEEALEKYRESEKYAELLAERHPYWNPEASRLFIEEVRALRRGLQESIEEKRSWENPLVAHFIDVGQGDGALIQTPDGSNIVIDAGWGTSPAWSRRAPNWPFVLNYLREAGVEKIDLMIATHPHADHIGGLVKLLEEFPVDVVLDPGMDHTSHSYELFLNAAKNSPNTKYMLGRVGQTFEYGDVEVQILHPSERLLPKANDVSIVARLVYDQVAFLFTGDAETDAEREILVRGRPLRANVLKVGHHGSRTSTTPSFFRAVRPEIAVISCGFRNTYGHPHRETMLRLQTANVDTYVTAEVGTVVIASNGRTFDVSLPGRAYSSTYSVAPEYEGKVIGCRTYRIFYPPDSIHYRSIPHEGRVYFENEAEALAAEFIKSSH